MSLGAYSTSDSIKSNFRNLAPQPNRHNRGWRGNAWEDCPIGLPFKVALQLHFEQVVTQGVIHHRRLTQDGLSYAACLDWGTRFFPDVQDYYFVKTGGRGLPGLGSRGHMLTGKALYQLVLNGGLYRYDRVSKRGEPCPSTCYVKNNPKWQRPLPGLTWSLVERVEPLVIRFSQKAIPVTVRDLSAIGNPFLRAQSVALWLEEQYRMKREAASARTKRLL